MSYRIEKDFLGEKEIPADAYYGVQTLRGKENFYITGIPMSLEPNFVKSFGYVKKAAALANRDLGVLDAKIADAIAAACDRLIAGEMRDQFVTDLRSSGSVTRKASTSTSARTTTSISASRPTISIRRHSASRSRCGSRATSRRSAACRTRSTQRPRSSRRS